MKTTELNKYSEMLCLSFPFVKRRLHYCTLGVYQYPRGTLGTSEGRENSVNRSSESLVYLTVNIVCNQQLVLVSVSLLQELTLFPPQLHLSMVILMWPVGSM